MTLRNRRCTTGHCVWRLRTALPLAQVGSSVRFLSRARRPRQRFWMRRTAEDAIVLPYARANRHSHSACCIRLPTLLPHLRARTRWRCCRGRNEHVTLCRRPTLGHTNPMTRWTSISARSAWGALALGRLTKQLACRIGTATLGTGSARRRIPETKQQPAPAGAQRRKTRERASPPPARAAGRSAAMPALSPPPLPPQQQQPRPPPLRPRLPSHLPGWPPNPQRMLHP